MSKLLGFRRLLNGFHQRDCLVGNITMGEIADALDKQAAEIERLRKVVHIANGWRKHCSSRQMAETDCGCQCCDKLDYALRQLDNPEEMRQ